MAGFLQNLRKIRGEAVYGHDMREAIAEAIEQASNADIDIDGEPSGTMATTPIVGTEDDYLLTFVE